MLSLRFNELTVVDTVLNHSVSPVVNIPGEKKPKLIGNAIAQEGAFISVTFLSDGVLVHEQVLLPAA